jgi:biopolymer transport protein TolR
MTAIRQRSRRRRAISEVNMVPFIDVMLVLLIIFMVTAPLISPSQIELPSIGKASKQPDEIIEVVIRKEDSYELKNKGQTTPVQLGSLIDQIKKIQDKTKEKTVDELKVNFPMQTAVVISADKTVQYERVVKVMDMLQRSGVGRIGLSVQLAP